MPSLNSYSVGRPKLNKETLIPKYTSFLRDESCLIGHADKIVFPTNINELVQEFTDATSQKSIVTVQGARTGLVGGAVPSGGIIINLSKMNKIITLCEQNDKTLMHVQAGVALQDIETEARKKGLCFPANPTEKTATIGGIFATGATGARKLMYGSTASYVQSIRWILPNGDVWDIVRGKYIFDEYGCIMPNGKSLKCRTDLPFSPLAVNIPRIGMDLIDFFAGSEGQFGVVAELELILLPIPKELWGVIYFFKKDMQALDFSSKLGEWRNAVGKDLLLAAEYFDTSTVTMLTAEKHQHPLLKSLPDFPKDARNAVYVELCSDDADTVEKALMHHLELFSDSGGDDENTWAENSTDGVQRLCDMRHAIIELINSKFAHRYSEDKVCVRYETDFTGSPIKSAEYITMYHKDMATHEMAGCVYGHILENNIHVALMPSSIEDNELCDALINQWAKIVMNDGGQLVSENGIGQLKRNLIHAHMPKMLKDEIKKIKNFFDPQGQMNIFEQGVQL